MKFDPNLIRDILISVSESISPDEYGFVSQIYPVDIAQNKLSDYSQNEVLYWIRQLMNSGILIEVFQNMLMNQSLTSKIYLLRDINLLKTLLSPLSGKRFDLNLFRLHFLIFPVSFNAPSN